MRIELSPEEKGLEFNSVNPLLRNARFCKAIAPKPGQENSSSRPFSTNYPRIVKSNFNVPPNWSVIKEVNNGQVLVEEGGRELIHTCEKPYDACDENGFWGRWKSSKGAIGITIITR